MEIDINQKGNSLIKVEKLAENNLFLLERYILPNPKAAIRSSLTFFVDF